jgi:hypothetical protein
MLQTLQELNHLQSKLNSAEAMQQQTRRQYEEQERLTKESKQETQKICNELKKLQGTYEQITKQHQAEKKKSANLETENSEKAQLLLQAEQKLRNAVSERDSSNRTADKLTAQKQQDTDTIRGLESERQALQETVFQQKALIEELKKKKPFVRKRTMLAWLDGWFLLFVFALLAVIDIICYSRIMGVTVVAMVAYSATTTLCWVLLRKNKYYWHAAVCFLEACLPMLSVMLLLESVGGVYPEVVIACIVVVAAYTWLSCISVLKEVP